MKDINDIDELFRAKLQNFEKEPPGHILENILSGTTSGTRRKKIAVWRIVAVAAMLLLAFLAGWQYNLQINRNLNHTAKTTQNAVEESSQKNIALSETATNTISGSPVQKTTAQNQRMDEKSRSDKTAPETMKFFLVVNDRSQEIKPIQSLSGSIQTSSDPEFRLHQKKTNDLPVKSIDQQIMEQNQQMLMAQTSVKEKGKWLMGAQVSPSYNVSNGSQTKQYSMNMLTTESTNQVDLGAGLTVEYKPGKRWSLQSGVYYSGLSQTSQNSVNKNSQNSLVSNGASDYLNTKLNVDAKTNKISMNSPAGVIEFNTIPTQLVIGKNIEANSMASAVFVSEAQFTQSFDYIEIPLYLRYTLLDTRFDIEMLGGLSSNVLVGNQAYLENSSGKIEIGKTQDMAPLNYSGTVGIGFKYGLSKSIFLNLEPRFKYYLNSLNSNDAVTYKPYTINIFTGLSYQF
jgi:hypothetical protein